jgi:mono/diheme cytochrome c family protein
MRSVIRVGLIGALLWAGAQSAAPVDAGCRERTVRRSVHRGQSIVLRGSSGLAIVPFAVPVAVPVAVVSQPTVLYAYSRYVPQPAAPATDATAAGERVTPHSIVARSCRSCHAGNAPAAGLDLSDLTRLEPRQRLQAIARVVSDDPAVRMPRGSTLSPADIGAAIQELSAAASGSPVETE